MGITAVVLLTSIGKGVQQFVLDEFTQFGTNLVTINPGKATTHGISMGVFDTERPLSIEDAQALKRLPYTLAATAIGGISLLVGAIGIVTIITIAVNERTSEIGLLRALGARQSQIHSLFLGEAIILAAIGGPAGLFLGIGIVQLLHFSFPALPVHISWNFVILAEIISITIGLLAGVLPARHADRLDPVDALRTE